MSDKTIFASLTCRRADEVRQKFLMLQAKHRLNPKSALMPEPLAKVVDITVNKSKEYGEIDIAMQQIREKAERNGNALAVPIRIGPGIDPQTGERLKHWLIGVKISVEFKVRKTG